MAQIQDLEVQCEKDLFRVRVNFDRPFYGMVFSKGYYSNVNCVHVPAGLGQTQATFDIAMGQVGSLQPVLLQLSLLNKTSFPLHAVASLLTDDKFNEIMPTSD